MNERIKGLLSKAHILAAEQHRVNCLATGKDPSMPHAGALNMTFEKFAELIVRECAKAVEDSIWHLPRGYKAVDQAKFVKKHFGVEE